MKFNIKNIKLISLTLFLLITNSIVICETFSHIDSLEQNLKNTTGLEKAELLNDLSEAYLEISANKSLEYGLNAIHIAIKNNFTNEEAVAMKNIAFSYKNKKELKNSLDCFQKALKLFHVIDDNIQMAICLNNIGSIYKHLGQYERAKEYYMLSLRVEERNIINKIKDIYLFQSEAYAMIGDNEKALEFFKLYTSLKDSLKLQDDFEKINSIRKEFEDEKENLLFQLEEKITVKLSGLLC